MMKVDKDQIKKSEAIEALNSIEKMKNASLKRALPPRWYSAVLATLSGSLVFLSAINLREYQVLIILLMAIVITYQVKKSGVSTKPVPIKYILIAMILLIPLYLILVITGQYLIPVLGSLSGPLLASALLAVCVYILSMVERHKYN